MLYSRPTLVFKPLVPHLPILSLLFLPPRHRPTLQALLLRLLPPLPLNLSGFFNGMLEVFDPGALKYFTFFCPILLPLSVSRNPILTHLPLSGFLDSLLCVLIAPTPSLAFSLQKALHSGRLQLPSPLLRLKRYYRTPREGSIQLGHLL